MKFDKMLDTFIEGDYFIIFLILTIIILIVLILALIKSRKDYNELLIESTENKDNELNLFISDNENLKQEEPKKEENDILDDLNSLYATTEEDIINAEEPLVKQVDINNIKTYDDEIDEYENSEEENAVISAEELEKKTRERMDALGLTDNQAAIQKYEEEQENKAIISYEQLLKNASNITLSYKDETKEKGSPKINKIEVEQKEVVGTEVYLEEEEFLKILKEFRISL